MKNCVGFFSIILVLHKSFLKSLLYVIRIYIAFQAINYGYPESCFLFVLGGLCNKHFPILLWNFSQGKGYRHFNLIFQQQPIQVAMPSSLEHPLLLTSPLSVLLPQLRTLWLRGLYQILQISLTSCTGVTLF